MRSEARSFFRHPLLPALLFGALLGLVFLVYQPGLSSGFLLDDHENLSGLSEISSLENVDEIVAFIATGHAGPSGRPVSMLSFALEHAYWYRNPETFKRTNLFLHLLTGTLIFWLFLLIGEWLGRDRRTAAWLAFFTGAIWLLHPIHISTVLYVVQRMTQLAALFSVAGLVSYVKGRRWIEGDRPLAGFLLAFGGLGAFAVLATLSKENGYFVFLYALALEVLLNGSRSRYAWFAKSFKYLLLAPIAIFVVYLAVRFDSVIVHNYAIRDFNMWERILTETRVLFSYLGQIFFPGIKDYTLFHDDYVASRGLFTPWTTLPSLLGVAGLIALAFLARHRSPVLSFAIAWFLFGHVLEGSVVPLELYFEHRNYLPLAGIAFALAWYLPALYRFFEDRFLRVVLIVLGGMAFGLVMAVSWNVAHLWTNPLVQAKVWAYQSPGSIRAQTNYATTLTRHGFLLQAQVEYERLTEQRPEDLNAYLFWAELSCFSPSIEPPDLERVAEVAHTADFGFGPLKALLNLKNKYAAGHCDDISLDQLIRITENLASNPNFHRERAFIYALLAHFYAVDRNLEYAGHYMERAFELEQVPILAITQARWLISAGLYDLADEYLDKAETALEPMPLSRLVYLPTVEKLRRINAKLRKESVQTEEPAETTR